MDGVNIPFSGDTKKAEAAFEKLKKAYNSLVEQNEKLKQKSREVAASMITDFKGVSISVEKADIGLAKLHLGHLKLNTAQMQLKNMNVFPKITSDIKTSENATSALIGKTMGFVASLGLAYKAINAIAEKHREVRALKDESYRTVGEAYNEVFVSGNIGKDKQDKLTAVMNSMSERYNLRPQETADVTQKLLSGGVAPENLSDFGGFYQSVRATRSQDAKGLTESNIALYKKQGGNLKTPDSTKAKYVSDLMTKGFGLEADQAGELLSGLDDKLSTEDIIALSNASKEKNFGRVRPSKADVKEATKGGKINAKTFKILGIDEADYIKSKKELTSELNDYSQSVFDISTQSPSSKDIRISNEQNKILYDPNLTPEEQLKKINTMFNTQVRKDGKIRGLGNETMKSLIPFASEETAQSIADWLQNPSWAGGDLQSERAAYQAKVLNENLEQMKTMNAKRMATKPIEMNDSKGVR